MGRVQMEQGRLQHGRPNYDASPHVKVSDSAQGRAWQGWKAVVGKLRETAVRTGEQAPVVILDCYPGVALEELREALAVHWPEARTLNAEEACWPPERIGALLASRLTEDRVFGILSPSELREAFDPERLGALRDHVEAHKEGPVVVYGTGAFLVHPGHVCVLADLPRWERQLRMRRGASNWQAENGDEDILRKYKRAYFWEWRVADRHKRTLFSRMHYLLDTTRAGVPKLLTAEAFLDGMRQTARRPFRVVPFFDPGVWGGQWMKAVCDLDRSAPNYAWCFDCVPEENSLCLKYGDITVEVPSINLVFLQPRELLGEQVFARFGAEFPIRFDFLDTVGGQNLSLQVHPLVGYIQEQFGMHYTQDESYYILDAEEGAGVYLGLKNGVEVETFLQALREAQAGARPFDAEAFVNRFPVRPHDHVLIPAGTVHCSGAGTMVLEISATPYIFTFKLWDWGRLGMDGQPRPVHIEHGQQVIEAERDTDWVQANLLNRIEPLASGEGWREERTGLHELQFIETRRHWFTTPVTHRTQGSVHVLNLVSGTEVIVESPEGAFEPFAVHFAETFIVPAAVGEYRIRPAVEGEEAATLRASVRL